MPEEDAKSGMPPKERGAGAAGDEAPESSRREFMKKLPYVAPVVQSFVLADTVYADKGGKTGRGGGRGRVSAPGQTKKDPPPPPPPPPAGD